MSLPKPWPEPNPVDDELLIELRRGVVEYDEARVRAVCHTIVERRMDAYLAIFEGLVAGMEEVGALFDRQEYFVPELLMCADAVYAGLEQLRPHITGPAAVSATGEVIIGAIEGDIHDFGKNLVKMVFEIAGFTVHDLGSDVPIQKFVKTALATGAPLALVSVMMSPCLPRVRELVEELHHKAPHARVMIGGCAVDADAVKQLGGDGAAKDAHHALREAIRLLSAARRMNESGDENGALL